MVSKYLLFGVGTGRGFGIFGECAFVRTVRAAIDVALRPVSRVD